MRSRMKLKTLVVGAVCLVRRPFCSYSSPLTIIICECSPFSLSFLLNLFVSLFLPLLLVVKSVRSYSCCVCVTVSTRVGKTESKGENGTCSPFCFVLCACGCLGCVCKMTFYLCPQSSHSLSVTILLSMCVCVCYASLLRPLSHFHFSRR